MIRNSGDHFLFVALTKGKRLKYQLLTLLRAMAERFSALSCQNLSKVPFIVQITRCKFDILNFLLSVRCVWLGNFLN